MCKYLCILILLLVSCTVKSNHNSTIVDTIKEIKFIPVKGFAKMQNPYKEMVYQDSLYIGHPVLIRPEGTKVRINYPTFFWMSNPQHTLYLIYPGEKINTSMDSNDLYTFSIAGNERRTNELAFFKLLGKETGAIYVYQPLTRFPKAMNSLEGFKEKETEIYTLKNRRLQILDSFANVLPVSDQFKKIAVNTIQCVAFKDSLALMYMNKSLLSNQNLYSSLLENKMESFKQIPYYPFFLYFNAAKSLVSLCTNKYLTQAIDNSIILTKDFDFVDSNFSNGITKDYLMANLISSCFIYFFDIPKPILNTFLKEVTDSTYKNIILNNLRETNKMVAPNSKRDKLYSDGKLIEGIPSVFSKYKGKLVYVDFWASWCMPCRGEMPYSFKLRKEYEHKPIVFIYISTDENKKDWLNASIEENLDKDINFLLLNSRKAEFVRQYKINSIPRYMLIDKDGKIISDNAPRPSDKALQQLIDKNL